MQTVTETSSYQTVPSVTTQNVQTQDTQQNPTANQSLVLNQQILQNQQVLYQLQRTNDGQQNLVYLIVPTNENIQLQSVPLAVVNEQQNITQCLDRTNSTIIIHDVKEEINETELYQEGIGLNEQKHIQYSYNTLTIDAKQNEKSPHTATTNYVRMCPKSIPSNNDNAAANKPHYYHCDYKDCAASFYSLYEKKQHLDAHIFPENTEFKCSICNMIFEKAAERNKHVESHAIPPTFKCKHCQKDFSYFTVLMKHLEEKKCTSKNPVMCFFCKAKITDYDELVRHNHLNMKQCVCGAKVCGNQAYELHLSVCKLLKNSEKVQSPFEKKRLKTKKT